MTVCGRRSSLAEETQSVFSVGQGSSAERVFQGDNANYGQYPWQVGVYIENVGHWCGGIIIGPYWILSAAHCFYIK